MGRLRMPNAVGAPAADGTLSAPAAVRNLRPILDVLLPRLPRDGTLLELASGTGQHIAALADRRPDLTFRPTDPDPSRRVAIDARCRDRENVSDAADLDAAEPGWAARHGPVEAILVVNLLHLISEAEMAVLLDEASRALAPGGLLAIYGPFLRDGQATSEGDAGFDVSLRAQDPEIGLKDVEVLTTVLGVLGLPPEVVEMPANNLMLVARSGEASAGL